MPNSPVLGAQRALGGQCGVWFGGKCRPGHFVADYVAPFARLVSRSMAAIKLGGAPPMHRDRALARLG
jgi:hypothetical protein